MSKRIHVVPHGSGWAMRREGATRAGSTHNTRADATQAARSAAVRERGEVIINRPDGRVRDANSYGNDRFPPKG